jgi:hypothetical protein
MDDEDLHQADLSHLRLADMTPAQKAEMRRRYLDFVRHHAKPVQAKIRTPGNVTKWVPGKRPG